MLELRLPLPQPPHSGLQCFCCCRGAGHGGVVSDSASPSGRGHKLQLAAPSFCVLLRLHLLTKDAAVASAAALLPPSLALLLGDVSILKLGVGIAQDLRLFHEQFGVVARGVVDVHILAACSGCVHAGLQRLTAVAQGLHLSKRIEIRCSDWEAATLSPDQIDYAAVYAHVALDIFSHFYDACASHRQCASAVGPAA
jgi:hypothetical protein